MMLPAADRETVFRSWLEEHRGIIMKVTRSFARSASERADLQQEMMLQLWISLAAFRGQAKPSTWIYRVCLNTALAHRRDTSHHERRIEPTAEVAAMSTGTADPAEDAANRELLERLYEGIRNLPDADRALMLMMLDGLSYRDIADVTGMSETHVGVALMRARKHLAARMKGVIDEME